MPIDEDYDELPVRDLDEENAFDVLADHALSEHNAGRMHPLPVLGQYDEQQVCPQCHGSFTVPRTRWYCSNACRQAAYRERKSR